MAGIHAQSFSHLSCDHHRIPNEARKPTDIGGDIHRLAASEEISPDVCLLANVNVFADCEDIDPDRTLDRDRPAGRAHGSTDGAGDPHVLRGGQNPACDWAGNGDHAGGSSHIAIDGTGHYHGLSGGIQVVVKSRGRRDRFTGLDDEA
jgi:hypothetical protein